ncbi:MULTISPECIES: hypothetical protein [Arthrobacter]|uniref:Phosphotyrosine protein phosphatase I domain-containing protein n=2 Tax=Arthrobacter TaxID=1663 RepID=A0ABU9KLE9_9MICC|nr:hypothetical protein [Arthrobacter sp. YJM1]MDP5227734.1 hypothetical protein [Arthrobacter sp. YJM1]
MSRRLRREEEPHPEDEVVTILTVCVGNVCRSPLAEQLIRARLAEYRLDHVELASAGLGAMVGEPMQPLPARWSQHYGGDPRGAVGKQICENYVQAADVILTLTRELRDQLVREYPRALSRTFSLGEFVALLELAGSLNAPAPRSFFEAHQDDERDYSQAGRFRELVRAAGQRRSLVAGVQDDVKDPMGRSEAFHEAVAAQIDGLSTRLVLGLQRRLQED